ncbi:SAF domain-containing protein [Plantactinospora sp. KLBMP9567]|uniref:SAF domain-containing protein n=1 Tax=Plantactinospora sp. KLBMP9567 TaxID=3085900 RepID=UPI002980C3FD|nr:SAF domain-containing protein [Plantactinospora sp. KLBMP9567]MDW5327892.1 SAF domain-containing protein [Plantactinospora sp. KLBMP9567]
MTVVTTPTTGAPIDAPITPPRIVRQRRMRPGLLGLAVLLIALGGLGSAFAITSVRATGSYLAVARAVPVGTALTADDLVAVQVAGGQGLEPVAADRIDEVLGKRATVTLTPGTLLTMAQLTDKPLLGPGQQQISVGLRPSEVPAKRLRPGDKVLLFSTAGGDARAAAPATRFQATVIDMAAPASNSVVLYLALAAKDVPAVVALATSDRIAVVLNAAA